MEDPLMSTETFQTHCFLCGAVARCRETDHGNRRYFRCTSPKCGEYEISHTAMGRLDTSADFKTHASETVSKLRDPEQIYEIVFDSATGCVSERVVTRRQELR
jgi:hypothetical protein